MKKTLLILLIGLLGWGTVCAQLTVQPSYMQGEGMLAKSAKAEGDVVFGYCNTSIKNGIGTGDSDEELKAAINLTKAKFGTHKGKTIRAVRVGLNEPVKEGTIFIKTTLEGDDLYSQYVGNMAAGWNVVYLETPYTVPDADFYMGYSCTGASHPIGFSGATTKEGSWLSVGGSWANYQTQNWGSLSFQIIMNETEHSFVDAVLTDMFVSNAATKKEFPVKGSIKNSSTKAIESFVVKMSVEGQEPVEKEIEMTLKSGASAEFIVNYTPIETEGDYKMDMLIDIDGDINEADNTLSMEFKLYDNFVQRKVLMEHFTTAVCPNCPTGHTYLEYALSSRENIIWVAHHAGYYTDIYTIKESEDYMAFYNSNSSYAPAVMLDRTNLKNQGAQGSSSATSPGPIFSLSSPVEKLMDYQLGQPAIVTVNIDKDYEVLSRELKLTVELNNIEGRTVPSGSRLTVFLTESGLVGTQSGAQGDYVHNHVIREVLSATWGDMIAFTDGKFTKEYTFIIPEEWDADNMEVVAFASKFANNVNEREVLNAEAVYVNTDRSVAGVKLDVEEASIEVGKTLQLTATVLPGIAENKKVTWSSSNEAVATISEKGLVTAVSEGTTTIKVVTEEGGFEAECAITVYIYTPVESISLDKEELQIEKGQTYQFTATLLPENASDKSVSWATNNSKVIELSTEQPGLIKAIADGNANLSVRSNDSKKTATCKVTVGTSSLDSVAEDNLIQWMYIGKSTIELQLTANGSVAVDLYDVNGRLVYNSVNTINGIEKVKIATPGMNGVYVVKVTTSEGKAVRKVVL